MNKIMNNLLHILIFSDEEKSLSDDADPGLNGLEGEKNAYFLHFAIAHFTAFETVVRLGLYCFSIL